MLTERQIQLGLWMKLKGSAFACPNYTPSGWTECDLWSVTKSGRSTEYEIKTNWTNFVADKHKVIKIMQLVDGRMRAVERNKHDLVSSGNGPSRFYFVVTNSIVVKAQDELPKWAGLIVVDRNGITSVLKAAPVLNENIVRAEELNMARGVFQSRYWGALQELNDALRQLNNQASPGGIRSITNARVTEGGAA